jgi:hypothetical protein
LRIDDGFSATVAERIFHLYLPVAVQAPLERNKLNQSRLQHTVAATDPRTRAINLRSIPARILLLLRLISLAIRKSRAAVRVTSVELRLNSAVALSISLARRKEFSGRATPLSPLSR